MNQQPDNFFRKKLEGFQKPAPSTAWKKIEAAQNKKNNKGLWLKVAASLFLLATFAYVLWPVTPEMENIAEDRKGSVVVKPDDKSAPPKENPSAIVAEKENESKAGKSTSMPKPLTRHHEIILVTKVDSDTFNLTTISTQDSLEVLQTSTVEPTLATTSDTPVAENITLVFTETEVNEYLHKKIVLEATDSIRKPSKWKKLLKKANDLTNNQDPFGELRQKKNEILALNFKNEKQRDQNK